MDFSDKESNLISPIWMYYHYTTEKFLHIRKEVNMSKEFKRSLLMAEVGFEPT